MRRRSFLQAGAAASALTVLPRFGFAQQLPFDPKPAGWRTFEVTTRVEILKPQGASRAWIPVPAVESDYQKVIGSSWSGNGSCTGTGSCSCTGSCTGSCAPQLARWPAAGGSF